MKEAYEKPVVEVVYFETEDVITVSEPLPSGSYIPTGTMG